MKTMVDIVDESRRKNTKKPLGEQMQKVADRYEKATGKKLFQKTNADHIRSMTDEELAVFLEGFGVCHYCHEYEEASFVEYGIPDCDGDCERHILDWLKQPYKEDT